MNHGVRGLKDGQTGDVPKFRHIPCSFTDMTLGSEYAVHEQLNGINMATWENFHQNILSCRRL